MQVPCRANLGQTYWLVLLTSFATSFCFIAFVSRTIGARRKIMLSNGVDLGARKLKGMAQPS